MPTDIILHTSGVEYTLTANGIYILAPEQRVQARPFQPPAEWPLLAPLRVFWPWPLLRCIWQAEERARKAEARRIAARRRGIDVVVDGEALVEPIKPRYPVEADRVMIAWSSRVREQALLREPICVEYGIDNSTRDAYRVQLIGAWTRVRRTDLQPETERSLSRESLDAVRVAAETIGQRLRRAGRAPVVLEAEAI